MTDKEILVERVRKNFTLIQRGLRGSVPKSMQPVWDIVNDVPAMLAVIGKMDEFERDYAAEEAEDAIASMPHSEQVEGETWESINQWCDDTFGPATPQRMIERAKEEFDELEIAETDEQRAIEAADVTICLCRIPGFAEALERKMAINRKRKWRLTGEGTGYHIPEAPALTRNVSDKE